MENRDQELDTQTSEGKKKRRRRKAEPLPEETSAQAEADEFEKRKLTHYLIKEIRLDDVYYGEHRQELEDILRELNAAMGKAAISLSADTNTVLKITINMDQFNMITQRKAGRKKKSTGITYDEIKKYRETHTGIETAEWLGLTKQTYYRKLREHKRANHDGSVEF